MALNLSVWGYAKTYAAAPATRVNGRDRPSTPKRSANMGCPSALKNETDDVPTVFPSEAIPSLRCHNSWASSVNAAETRRPPKEAGKAAGAASRCWRQPKELVDLPIPVDAASAEDRDGAGESVALSSEGRME